MAIEELNNKVSIPEIVTAVISEWENYAPIEEQQLFSKIEVLGDDAPEFLVLSYKFKGEEHEIRINLQEIAESSRDTNYAIVVIRIAITDNLVEQEVIQGIGVITPTSIRFSGSHRG